MIASYGGYEGLTAKADYYDSVGDTESANNLRRLYAMQQINDNFASTGVLNYNGVLATLFGDSTIFSSAADEYGIMQAQKSPFLEYMQDYISSYTAETARQTAAAFSGENGRMDDYLAEVGKGQNANDVNGAWSKMSKTARSEYQRMVESLRAVYDFDKVLADETNVFAQDGSAFQDDAAVYSLLYGNASRDLEKYKITTEIDPILDEGAMQDAVGDQTITVPVEPEVTEYSAEIAKQTIAAVGGGICPAAGEGHPGAAVPLFDRACSAGVAGALLCGWRGGAVCAGAGGRVCGAGTGLIYRIFTQQGGQML